MTQRRLFGRMWFLWTCCLMPWPGIDVTACPFCSAVSQTLDEEIRSMDVAVFAELLLAAKISDEIVREGVLPLSRFRVTERVKGDGGPAIGDEVEVSYFGPDDKSQVYMLMAAEGPELFWGTPLVLTAKGADYIRQLIQLPDDPSRLPFFWNYLEDPDEMLSRDAYDEFAKAPYADIVAIRDVMDRRELLRWIQDEDVWVEHRRLYLTMLGICGNREDAEVLADLIRSDDPSKRAGMNALVGAYLSLTGEAGLPLIEETFLANPDAKYVDIHAAIMALRFHGNETDRIPLPAILKSLHYVLERNEIADLVIPDLARWEDWSVLPRLVELFEKANADSNWVRVPVVNYVRACPLPEASEAMARLEEIDAEAVRRSSALFPFPANANDAAGDRTANPAADATANSPLPTREGAGGQEAEDLDDLFTNQAAVPLEAEEVAAAGDLSPLRATPRSADLPSVVPTWVLWLLTGAVLLAIALGLSYWGRKSIHR